MIKLTEQNKTILFLKFHNEFLILTKKLLFRYGLSGIFEASDLVDETFLKLIESKKEFVDDESHFKAYFYVTMKWTAKGIFRESKLRKQVEFNPDYHSLTGLTINGMFDDDYFSECKDEEIPANIIQDSINEIKNPTSKRLANLLTHQLDYDRISEITGIEKGVNLRVKIYEARSTLFAILQKKGLFKGLNYSDFKSKKIKTSNCVTMEFDKLKLNKMEYMYNDYPSEKTIEEKILFVLYKYNPIDIKKLIAIVALNEDERTNTDSKTYLKGAIGDIRVSVKKALKNLSLDNSIHIEESIKIYSNQ